MPEQADGLSSFAFGYVLVVRRYVGGRRVGHTTIVRFRDATWGENCTTDWSAPALDAGLHFDYGV